MTEVTEDGREVVRWLRTPGAEVELLVGCGWDDGDSEDLPTVAAVDLAGERIVCAAEGGRPQRVPFARVQAGTLVLSGPDHPLRAALEAMKSPAERAEAEARALVRKFVSRPPASHEDLQVLHAAAAAQARGDIPDRALRRAVMRALRKIGDWRAGESFARAWRQAAAEQGRPPEADVVVALAVCLRHQFRPVHALEEITSFREGQPRLSDVDTAVLATTEAGVRLDLFERDRNREHLVRARECALEARKAEGFENARGGAVESLLERLARLERE